MKIFFCEGRLAIVYGPVRLRLRIRDPIIFNDLSTPLQLFILICTFISGDLRSLENRFALFHKCLSAFPVVLAEKTVIDQLGDVFRADLPGVVNHFANGRL